MPTTKVEALEMYWLEPLNGPHNGRPIRSPASYVMRLGPVILSCPCQAIVCHRNVSQTVLRSDRVGRRLPLLDASIPPIQPDTCSGPRPWSVWKSSNDQLAMSRSIAEVDMIAELPSETASHGLHPKRSCEEVCGKTFGHMRYPVGPGKN